MQVKENLRGILYILISLGTGVLLGALIIVWLHTPPAKANQIRPLLKEIDDYKARNGKYPISCEQFASFAELTNHFSVYTGSTNQGGYRFWNYWEVQQHDFSILMNFDDRESGVYEIFFPVAGTERMRAVSFHFAAWRYDFKDGHWQKGRIYYSSFGPYWKADFLP